MTNSVLSLTNNRMQLELIAVIGKDAFLKRVNDSSYVVCNNIEIHNDFTCTWGFAYGYFEEYDDAYECFMEKVVKRFAEYQENLAGV